MIQDVKENKSRRITKGSDQTAWSLIAYYINF